MTSPLPGPRTTGVLLVLAAAGEMVEAALSPLVGTTRADLAAIAAHQTRFTVSVTIGVVATLLYIPGFLGLARWCAARRPRLAAVSAWAATSCMVGFVAVRVSQGVELAAVRERLPRATAVRLIDGMFATPFTAPFIVMFLLGTVVGVALLAVTTWRSGMPRTASLLLLLFPVLELAGFSAAHWWTVVSHTPLLAATVVYAVALWRLPDAEAHGRTEGRAHPVADRDEPDLVAPGA